VRPQDVSTAFMVAVREQAIVRSRPRRVSISPCLDAEGPIRTARGGGFTLLEVLVALAVVGIAVTGLLQLSSQSLRLLKLSGQHVEAINLADRLAREVIPEEEITEQGEDAGFRWERKVSLVETPSELDPTSGQVPQLFAVSVAVRWGGNRAVEVATMRAVMPSALTPTEPGRPGPPGSQESGIVPRRSGQPSPTGGSTIDRGRRPPSGGPSSSVDGMGRQPLGGGVRRLDPGSR
jgi:prepilin-type N-terminal cleavage/methylation domain-containing protein